MPKQENKGSGTVQMGNVRGQVQNVTHVTHQYFYGPPPQSLPAEQKPTDIVSAVNEEEKLTTEQLAVLALLRPLDPLVKKKVYKWMALQFNTTWVKELPPDQVFRTRRYLEAVHKNERERS
ncbi:hypothetical protein [Acidovorax sp. SUPP2825]|uniref:hypothetical protein n=1 Tax=Acidovorax sp. SUPP2825 TaxID=2920879 RepID=UPI0023DE60A6|nr:hypothetical protein [Acidovorax sp. SUPP2825]GKS97003.1 hypothetical protein AVAK2825_20730 [Acidovorax sp. SUPP2825]